MTILNVKVEIPAVEALTLTPIKLLLLQILILVMILMMLLEIFFLRQSIIASREEHQPKPTGPNKLLMVDSLYTGSITSPDAHLPILHQVHPLVL